MDDQLRAHSQNIILHSLENSLKALYNNKRESSEDAKFVSSILNDQMNSRSDDQQNFKEFKTTFGLNLLDYSQEVLNQKAKEFGFKFTLTNEAKNLLSDSSFSIKAIESAINKACKTASIISLTANSKGEIAIKAEYLDLPKFDMSQLIPEVSENHSETQKVLNYMDELAAAVKFFIDRNEKPIADKVAKKQNGTRGANITYYLNQHNKKIKALINDHPTRWRILEDEDFKPFTNMMRRT